MREIRADDSRGGARPAPSRRARREERRERRRQLLIRSGILASAVAIPTFAMHGEWTGIAHALGISQAQAAVAPMPFETAGQSFPGSAFYYLEDEPRLTYSVADLRKSEGVIDTRPYEQEYGAGAAAKAFQMAGSGLDKARALQCLSMAVYYEAASESLAGQEAVAQVVLNRVAHPAYPNSVCGVVFQGSERKTGCQFTFTCDGSLIRHPSRTGWARAQSVALAALAGHVYSPVGLATHYHTHAVNPYWASSLDYLGRIGAHLFYRWKGKAGQAAAFNNGYFGGEPMAAPVRGPEMATGQADNPAIPASSFTTSPAAGALATGATPFTPATAVVPSAETAPAVADTLPKSGGVRPEYENSGRWIRQPGK